LFFSFFFSLVIDLGSLPAAIPTVPSLPQSYVAALWFGSNGNILRLAPTQPLLIGGSDSLMQGNCVNGGGTGDYTPFGQFSYCNAPEFFAAARRLIWNNKLKPPSLGKTHQHITCPSVRDFSVVDQDPSDNVITKYIQTKDNKFAQDTPANRLLFPDSNLIENGSDNLLLSQFIAPAIGCQTWQVNDLADISKLQKLSALPLNEIQAALFQSPPIALVPSGDPMTFNANGQPDLNKLNYFRRGVGQFEVASLNQQSANQITNCKNMVSVGATRILKERGMTILAPTPVATMGTTLFGFLVSRFTNSMTNLNCLTLLNITQPFISKLDANGAVTDATLDQGVITKVNNIKDPSSKDTHQFIKSALNLGDLGGDGGDQPNNQDENKQPDKPDKPNKPKKPNQPDKPNKGRENENDRGRNRNRPDAR
jgi:hypothetical protein